MDTRWMEVDFETVYMSCRATVEPAHGSQIEKCLVLCPPVDPGMVESVSRILCYF